MTHLGSILDPWQDPFWDHFWTLLARWLQRVESQTWLRPLSQIGSFGQFIPFLSGPEIGCQIHDPFWTHFGHPEIHLEGQIQDPTPEMTHFGSYLGPLLDTSEDPEPK